MLDQTDGLVPQTGVSSPQTGVRGLKRLQAEHGRLIFPERGRLIGLGEGASYFDALGADAAGAAGRFPQLLQP